jgi:hypothetical protein
MSAKQIRKGGGVAGAALAVLAIAIHPCAVLAGTDDTTTSIKRESGVRGAPKTEEPHYQTREERLKAKPLDWKSTIGKPKRRVLSPAERKALRAAKPKSSEGGAPNPEANEEARRLHPEDWKQSEPATR